jgi:hypothetical protein
MAETRFGGSAILGPSERASHPAHQGNGNAQVKLAASLPFFDDQSMPWGTRHGLGTKAKPLSAQRRRLCYLNFRKNKSVILCSPSQAAALHRIIYRQGWIVPPAGAKETKPRLRPRRGFFTRHPINSVHFNQEYGAHPTCGGYGARVGLCCR